MKHNGFADNGFVDGNIDDDYITDDRAIMLATPQPSSRPIIHAIQVILLK